jgi:threonine dehydrogenase-like Zn-dependent dehydrogenase
VVSGTLKIVARGAGVIELERVSTPPLGADQVGGPTLVSLVSPGTELAIAYLNDTGFPLPADLGYAAVFRVDEVGAEVPGVSVGDVVMSMGPHASWQRQPAARVVVLPPGLEPARAVFARIMNVSLSGLVTSSLRPGLTPAVVGLGLVGQMAARALLAQGYSPIAVDSSADRRAFLPKSRRLQALERLPDNSADVVIECTGKEPNVAESVRGLKVGGEVVLCGLAWTRHSDTAAFDLLAPLFRKFGVIRSGWEWQLPWQCVDNVTQLDLRSTMLQSLAWLADGVVDPSGLVDCVPPEDAPAAYETLKRRAADRLSFLIDWEGNDS